MSSGPAPLWWGREEQCGPSPSGGGERSSGPSPLWWGSEEQWPLPSLVGERGAVAPPPSGGGERSSGPSPLWWGREEQWPLPSLVGERGAVAPPLWVKTSCSREDSVDSLINLLSKCFSLPHLKQPLRLPLSCPGVNPQAAAPPTAQTGHGALNLTHFK
uniref:Uncharacterized protein n=1 Tax=Knipowitschia caucasica TaxID=637954 RepID=A0AAV2MNV1_KNICA